MKKGIALVCSIILFVSFTAWSTAFELSADMITKDGSSAQVGKLYVKGNKYRIEMAAGSEYAIIRHDRNISWVVLPEQKTYIEMPFDPKNTPAIEEKYPGEVHRKFILSEVLDGRATNKYQVAAKDGGRTEYFYQWVATDLNFPVKTSSLSGSWSIEYRNIQTSVPDALFELPSGYQKLSLPGRQSEK